MGRVDGKKAFITGAASGLGRATAHMFAREGAQVVIADINEEGAQKIAQEIGAQAHAVALDVSDEKQWQTALNQANEMMDGISILVNNAGIGGGGTVEETDFETWKHVMAVDADSVFLGCKYALPLMKPHSPGAIVNISSIAGLIAGHNMAAYNAAKAAVWLLTKSVALHCARQGYDIRCNSVHPTFINTPILQNMAARSGGGQDKLFQKLARQVPLGRIGEPDDIAYAVLYLASDESKFVTGAELKVDGGISAM